MRTTLGLTDRLMWDSPIGWGYANIAPHSHAGVYADVAELLALRPDDDLLDIGCGPGAFLSEHGRSARTVTGLERSASTTLDRTAQVADIGLLEFRSTARDLRIVVDGLNRTLDKLADPRTTLLGPGTSQLGPGER